MVIIGGDLMDTLVEEQMDTMVSMEAVATMWGMWKVNVYLRWDEN